MPAGNVGDLLVAARCFEGSAATCTNLNGNINGDYTLLPALTNAAGEPSIRVGWKIATSGSSENVTATFAGTPTFPAMYFGRFRATGTISNDASATIGASSVSSGVPWATGTFTTATSNGLTVFIYKQFTATGLTATQVGGNSPSAFGPGSQTADGWSWYYTNTAQLVNATAGATYANTVRVTGYSVSFNAQ